QGFSQGIQLGYESDAFRVAGYYGDGFGADQQIPGYARATEVDGVAGGFLGPIQLNPGLLGGPEAYILASGDTGFNTANSPWTQRTTKWSVAVRGEYKISGDWSTFDDFTSFRGEEGGMMVGVAVRGQAGAGTTDDFSLTDDSEIFGVTADFTWDFGGANLYAAFVYQDINWGNQNVNGILFDGALPPGNQFAPIPAGTSVDLGSSKQMGFMVQGGYFVTEEIEVFGRYEYIDYGFDQDISLSNGGAQFATASFNEWLGNTKYNGLTIGANYFFASNVKATVEWGYNFDSLSSVSPDLSNAGYRPDTTANGKRQDGQWALRAQLQLLF
ncbi:MAG: hypothetical protein GY895_08560, partial [Phycisphaera sp.]|nr:hypothetical protein [Phycisphaera sp.]